MTPELTAEQKGQLKTWAEQRDAFLAELSGLRNERDGLQKINNELAVSSSEMEDKRKVVQGRIEELKIKEAELPGLISKDIAKLQSEKSALEAEIPLIKQIIEGLSSRVQPLEEQIESALSTFNIVKDEGLLLEKVINHVTVVSKGNQEKIDLLVKNLAESLELIIEVNQKNVAETNIVIDKLPRMLVEIQKKGLIKKL